MAQKNAWHYAHYATYEKFLLVPKFEYWKLLFLLIWNLGCYKFYQKFWDVIKEDLMALFSQLHNGDLSLYKLNYGIITLLPKKENVVQI
jgi:hypothetical protein